MDESKRRLVAFAVGLLLVAVPLYAPALHITGPTYEYSRARITSGNDTLRIADDGKIHRGIEGFDCLRQLLPSRVCVYEAGALNGTVTADHPNIARVSGRAPISRAGRYVSFGNGMPVFRRTADWKSGSYVLGLERVSAADALDDVAIDEARAPKPMVTAAKEGSVKTHEKLPSANSIVATSDGYFVVYRSGEHSFLNAKPGTERIFEWIAVLLGADLLRRL